MKNNLTVLTLTLLMAGAASATPVTFLNLNELLSSVNMYTLTNNGGTSNTLSVVNGSVVFNFSVPNALGTGFRNGVFNFTANSTTPATVGSGNYTEQGFSGSGTILDSLTNTIAFSWTFGPTATFTGAVGGTSATFNDSTPPNTEINYISPYLTFPATISESFSFGFTSAIPAYLVGAGGFLDDATGSGVATFSSNPGPSGAPEPATAFLLGSALVGLALIGRKRLAR